MLDEPTNHLDVEALAWLEDFVRGCPHAMLIVSHDHAFLRSFAERVVEVRAGLVRLFPGGYDDYLECAGWG